MAWFLKDFDRFSLERREVEVLQSSVTWLKGVDWGLDAAGIWLEAEIEAHGHSYPIRMTYPNMYPANPPSVYPKDKAESLSLHQYASGELCLEWGPDTWRPEITGARMLESAFRLFETENPKGKKDQDKKIFAPSRHALSLGQKMRANYLRFLASPFLMKHLKQLASGASGELTCLMLHEQNSTFSGAVIALKYTDGQTWEDDFLPKSLHKYGFTRKGIFLKAPLGINFSSIEKIEDFELPLKDYPDFMEKIRTLSKEPENFISIFVNSSPEEVGFFSFIDGKPYYYQTLNLSQSELTERLGHRQVNLANKKVGIVGLGSAGSKIANTLARSGVGNFLLIDDDIFLPENVCRHSLDWRNIGEHKVNAIDEQIKLLYPAAKVNCMRVKLQGQESSSYITRAINSLTECDLIIDATADPKTLNQLSMIAIQSKKTLVWLEVYGGGIGGLIARYKPNEGSDPHRIRDCYNAYTASQNKPLDEEVGRYAINGDQGVQIAFDADVSVISLHAARFALDSLLERTPSIFPHPAYFIGLSRGWIFDQPFHVIPINVDAVEVKEFTAASPQVVAESMEFIGKLLDKAQNADNTPPQN